MRRGVLFVSASALALSWAGAAYAAATQYSDTVETVTVTAERRTENLMTSGISATVISGEDLTARNVVQVSDLQFIAPQVTVDTFGQGIDFNIRGIGKGEHNSATATGVITYRDGTPTFPGYMSEEPYYDIKSIQILRGPQGTFVGQNATGGAVFVTTNDPQIGGGFDGYVMANAGNYAELGVQGAVNIPISDTFAMRVAGYFDRRDTFYQITNNDPATNNGNTEYRAHSVPQFGALRVSFLWKPVESWSFMFKTDNDYMDNGPLPAGTYTNLCKYVVPDAAVFGTITYGAYDLQYTGHPANRTTGCGASTDPGAISNPNYTGDPLKFTNNGPNRFLDKFTRNTLTIEHTFPDGTILRSISSWSKGNTTYETDLDGTDTGTYLSASMARNYLWYDSVGESMFNEEINIISPSDQRITWILGAFMQHDEYIFVSPWKLAPDWPGGTTPFADPLDGIAPSSATSFEMQGHNPKASWALFGQTGIKLFGGLEASLGVRWTAARQKEDLDIWSFNTHIHALQATKSYSFDYKAALNWTIDENNFVYGFIATGFKPGGLNTPASSTTTISPVFGPERIKSYEVGYKGTWFDGHIRAQVDGYYYSYDHFQVSIGNPDVPYIGLELNTAKPTIEYGFEGELDAVFGNFAANLGIGWLHSEIGEFWSTNPLGKTVYYTNFGPLALPCDPATGPVYPSYWGLAGFPSATYNSTCLNLKGHPQTYAPSLTANINIEYRFDIGDGDTLTPRLSYAYQGTQWATLFDDARKGDKLGVRNLLGAQLEWKHGDYLVTAYATNLTDSHYVTAVENSLAWGGPPRQYGIRVMRAF
jgi:iron complex outermembrane recepter protein